MGVVYLAEDETLRRRVAIKSMLSGRGSDERDQWMRERFLQEARAVALLNHPSIVSIYDMGEHDGTAYIVMEYVAGQSLAGVLKKGGLRFGEALQMLRQTADGLDYAHSKGVVHRDIKPANLLIAETGETKITDFGIAKLLTSGQKTTTGVIMGTMDFISPEPFMGVPVDGRADQYSLASLAYALITGRNVFRAENAAELTYKICHEIPALANTVRPDLPAGCGDVLGKALSKNPGDRFGTCHEFVAALEATFGGLHPAVGFAPAVDRPTDLPTATMRPSGTAAPVSAKRRSPLGWILGAAALAAMGVGGYLMSPKPALVAVKTEQAPPRRETAVSTPIPDPPIAKKAERKTEGLPVVKPETPPAYSGPPEGRLVWTGELEPGATITLSKGAASAGSVTGALPGVPVNLEIHPSGVGIVTPPGKADGWQRMVLKNEGRKQLMLLIKWTLAQP